MRDGTNEQWYEGMYADGVNGFFILIAVFFFYVAIIKVCYWTCHSEKWARRFINFFTYGLNSIFIFFILSLNPFSSFNNVIGFLGAITVSTFITFMFNAICCDIVIEDIEIRNERNIKKNN
jgi:hypothetical protein